MSATREVPRPNVETSIRDLNSRLTGNASFFVRSHFVAPIVDLGRRRLTVLDESARPIRFSYDELRGMRQKTVTATLECAGNGRTGFRSVAEGEVPWGIGAVGTAICSGVPLRELLSGSKMSREASQVVVEGEDSGPVHGKRAPLHYVRALPLKVALGRYVILALKMNAEPLPVEHGFPARLIVPGWYGMASVKWVRSLRVLSGPPLETHFNTKKYVYVTERRSTPVREMRVKSLVTSPRGGERMHVGQSVAISGKAWSGTARIVRVEVGVDGRWNDARIAGRTARYSWTRWTFPWVPKTAGDTMISARATDSLGNVQPTEAFENRYQCGFNAVRPVKVNVLS